MYVNFEKWLKMQQILIELNNKSFHEVTEITSNSCGNEFLALLMLKIRCNSCGSGRFNWKSATFLQKLYLLTKHVLIIMSASSEKPIKSILRFFALC